MTRSTIDVSGTWHNQYGSVLKLEVSPDGRLSGKFKSGIGLAKPGDEFDVTGFASGSLVAFSVNFGKYESLTSWSGHVTSGKDAELRTMWHMVSSPSNDSQSWKGIWTGADIFHRDAVQRAVTDLQGHVPSHPASWPDAHALLGAMAALAGPKMD